MSSERFRSGFVTLVGRPNVGKSTLLNRLLGEKVAIVTPKPQTTRDRIRGIRTDAESQIVFIDTPGIHKPFKKLNRAMVDRAVFALQDVDVVALLVDVTQQLFADDGGGAIPEADAHVLRAVAAAATPTILVLNKIDRLREKQKLLPVLARWKEAFSFAALVPLSALSGEGTEGFLEEVLPLLPEGPHYYGEDELTDRSTRFLVSEIIREKLILATEREIPYAVAVEVESLKRGPRSTTIQAVIHVERESQKGIVIGKKGAMLKWVGTEARLEIEELLRSKVGLTLFVRVEPFWTERKRGLKRFGYVD